MKNYPMLTERELRILEDKGYIVRYANNPDIVTALPKFLRIMDLLGIDEDGKVIEA